MICIIGHSDRTISEHVSLYSFYAGGGAKPYTRLMPGWDCTLPISRTSYLVAKGSVHAASYKRLAIFGLGATATTASGTTVPLQIVRAGVLNVWKRNGELVTVDTSLAAKNFTMVTPEIGHRLRMRSYINQVGSLWRRCLFTPRAIGKLGGRVDKFISCTPGVNVRGVTGKGELEALSLKGGRDELDIVHKTASACLVVFARRRMFTPAGPFLCFN